MREIANRLGKDFRAKYEIVRELGEGSTGLVLLCKQRELNRFVAIKLFTLDLDDKALKCRFKREAAILSQFRHENVVPVFDYDVANEIPYFVQEYLQGTPLDQFLEKRGYLSLEKALDFTNQIAAGLHHAHQKQIVHRDLKPANIIVCENDKLKIVDFGLAQGPISMTRLTETGTVLGTPYYMAPEQLTTHYASDTADLYSLGVILYEMLTGRLPYVADSLPALLTKKLDGDVVPIEEATSRKIPKDVVKLVNDLMKQDSSKRPQSAEAVLKILSNLSPRGKLPKTKKKSQRSFLGPAFVLLVVTLSFLGVIYCRHSTAPVHDCQFLSCEIQTTPLSLFLAVRATEECRLSCQFEGKEPVTMAKEKSWQNSFGPFLPDETYKVKLILHQRGRVRAEKEIEFKTAKWRAVKLMDNKRIYYQPALWRNKLVISFHSGELVCFDGNTFDVQWKVSHQLKTGELLIDDKAVYLTEIHHSKVHAFNIINGTKLWTRQLPGDVDREVFANSENLFIRTREHGILCLDKKTGTTMWQSEGSVMAPWTATEEVVVYNKMVQVLPYQKVLSSKTGLILKSSGRPTATALSDYLQHNGRLYYVNLNHEIIEKTPRKSSRVIFKGKSKIYHLAIGDNRIYGLSKKPPYLVSHEMDNGEHLWSREIPNPDKKSCTLLYWKELLFLTIRERGLFVYDGQTGRELFRSETAIAGNFGVTVGPFGCLYSMDERTIGFLPKFGYWPPEVRLKGL